MRGPPNSAKNSQTQTEDGKAKPDIVEELKKKDLRILRDINFEAQPGELIAVVG
jgi:ABC-type polysaccharide/polyol phosphate transport system ATPase subunit